MINCPKCGAVSKARSSRYFSSYVKERYGVCQNKQCKCVFNSLEMFERFITRTATPEEARKAAEKLKLIPPSQPTKRHSYATRLE